VSERAAPAAKWRDLGIRTVSAAVLIPAVIADVWLGGMWFTLLIAVLGVIMAHEWVNIVHGRNSAQFALHAAAALLGTFLPHAFSLGATLAALAVLLVLSALLSFIQRRPHSLWTVCGIPYVGLPAMAFVILRSDPETGLFALLWLLAVVWCADIAAYFLGRIIGGPKLWPAVSPNKTWAGLAGAILGGLIAGIVAAFVLSLSAILPLALTGALLGLFEQGGDLFESALKRHHGVKDSGDLIPGHGGLLDRVDGLVAAALILAAVVLVGGNGLFAR
jgi:phosphatidate cytidylyltransferase